MRKKLNQRLQATSAALALVAISATAGGPPSVPQLVPAIGGKSATSHTAFAGPLDSERSFNRLIIKFKTSATTRAGVFDFRAAQDKVTVLAASAKKRNADSVGLRQLKSVSAQTQVALTDKAMTRGELFALAKQLEQDPSVEYAEIDEVMHPQFVPTDPAYAAFQWHYKAPSDAVGGANLPSAWDLSKGAGVVVAVIDTGYRLHADLASSILPGYDFISSLAMSNDGDGWDNNALDPGDWTVANQCSPGSAASNSSWHGTHVAGTIAALTNNGIGGAGVAFEAKVLPVRVLGTCGGNLSDIAAGMRWAAGLNVPGAPLNPNKAKVLNLSLGGSGACGATAQDAVNDVRAAGSVVVVATGNNGSPTTIGTPANCTGVIAVTAHTQSGDNAGYSNVGAGTTISAPGGGTGATIAFPNGMVYSTLNAGTTVPGADSYAGYQGTSMATPHVAGVAALLASLQPNITPDAMASVLTNSARSHPAGTYCAGLPSPTTTCGAGLLDAALAVVRLNTLAPSVAPTAGAGVQQTGATITLTGHEAVQPGGKAIASRLWVQTAGPAVTLSSVNTATTTFTAPSTGATYTFRYTVTDVDGLAASDLASVQSNSAPVLGAIASQSVVVGQNLSFTASATDVESNPVAFVGTGLPAGATLNAATGVFTWNAAGPVGNYSATITPNDGTFSGTPQTVGIAVVPVGGAPAPAPAATGGGGGGALNAWDLLALLALSAVSWGAARRRTPQ